MRHKPFYALCIILLSAFLFFTPSDVPGETETAVSDENWSFVLYNNNAGMPFSEANSLQQTQDGFIYIGCYGGLLRFDGEEFYRYDDPRLNNIIALFVDSRDRLWIATTSDGFGVMEDGNLTFYGVREGLNEQYVCCFAEDDDGNILVGTVGGLYYVNGDNKLNRLSDPLLDENFISRLCRDGQGMIYGLTKNSDIFTIQDLSLASWHEKGTFTTETITCIYADPKRSDCLYMGLEAGGLLHGDISAHSKISDYIPTPDLVYINGLLYADDRLWIASDRGIAFIDSSNRFIRPDKMQRSNSSQFIMNDLEGNIWIASDRLGVIKLSPSIFCNINSQANLPDIVVNTTCMKDGILYIGSDNGLICLNQDYDRVETPVSSLLENARIRCILEDRTGNLWFCSYGDNGLVRMDAEGNIKNYTTDDGFATNSVRDIYEMNDGTLVAIVKGGIYYISDGKIVRSIEEKDGLVNPQTLTVCEYEQGELLIGSDGNGLYLIRDGQVETIPEAEKLASDVILRIRKNEAQNSWWIVTSRSLFILHKGKIREVSDLPTLHNYDVEFDSRGNAWLLAADGIYVSAARNLLSGKKVRYIHYDYRSGLPFIVTPHCRNYISDDGVLYMSGNDGVVRISINSVSEHKANVQLTVPYIEVDGKTRQLTPGEKVTLQPWTKRIWVHPFALSYSLNEPIVAYSLDGFDDSLHISNRSELPSIIYTNLKGGFYTFRFAILNPTTGEIEKEITVPIEKRKALHERILFWVLLAAAAAGLVMLFLKLYLRKKAREMEAEKEQDRIRTELSVARDIQSSMLPRTFPPFPEKKEIDLYASMQPAKEVAGDFYDFFLIDDDHLALAIADVSGKGMGPALFMMVAKNTLKSSAMSGRLSSPGEILADVNNKLCKDNEALLFVTVWLGILTISTGKLVSANDGHEYPVIYRKDEGYSLIKDKHGLALGIMEDVVYKETEWTLGRGDGIFVYTDGVPEATDARNQLFGTERMLSALEHHSGQCPEDVLNGVHRAVDEFVGEAPQFDDLTMLAITYKG